MPDQLLSSPEATPSTHKNTLCVEGEAGAAGALFSFCSVARGEGRGAQWAQWERIAADWLTLKHTHSASEHTLHAYALALGRWLRFLATCQHADGRGVAVWEATGAQVRAWQAELRAQGLKETSVNHALACVSSFYTFALHEPGSGLAANPCRENVVRGRVAPYAGARPLTVEEYDQLLTWLESQAHTLAGVRSHALLRTYLHTGWRSTELLRMRWGDVRPHRAQPGAYVFAWQGKGGKQQDDILPADCHAAIVRYLQLDGRWPATGAQMAVWQAVAAPNMGGLRNGTAPGGARGEGRGAISGTTARRILRGALAGAGIEEPWAFRVHDLRHTHAHLLLLAGHNLATVQSRLHHSSLATTGIYARTVFRDDPEDVFSESFRRLRK
jgi:site-specific recombinase XerD